MASGPFSASAFEFFFSTLDLFPAFPSRVPVGSTARAPDTDSLLLSVSLDRWQGPGDRELGGGREAKKSGRGRAGLRVPVVVLCQRLTTRLTGVCEW